MKWMIAWFVVTGAILLTLFNTEVSTLFVAAVTMADICICSQMFLWVHREKEFFRVFKRKPPLKPEDKLEMKLEVYQRIKQGREEIRQYAQFGCAFDVDRIPSLEYRLEEISYLAKAFGIYPYTQISTWN